MHAGACAPHPYSQRPCVPGRARAAFGGPGWGQARGVGWRDTDALLIRSVPCIPQSRTYCMAAGERPVRAVPSRGAAGQPAPALCAQQGQRSHAAQPAAQRRAARRHRRRPAGRGRPLHPAGQHSLGAGAAVGARGLRAGAAVAEREVGAHAQRTEEWRGQRQERQRLRPAWQRREWVQGGVQGGVAALVALPPQAGEGRRG